MQKKRILTILAKAVVFVLIFAMMASLLGMLVYPKTGETTPKMVTYRAQEEAPELLMLGTSAMYHAIVPMLYEERTGLDCYDLCTPAQTMLSSYTLLVDSIQQGKIPDSILLYTNIRRFCREHTSNYDYQVMANLPFGYNKLRMLVNGFSLPQWPEALLRAVRARENFNLKFIQKNWERDYSVSVEVGNAPEEYIPYIGDGYSFDERAQDPNAVVYSANSDAFTLESADRVWFDKIVKLCEKHDIELIMIAVPRLPANVISSGDYDGFHQYMNQLAEETGIQFWDLTYLREDQMVVKSEHFRDQYHGNSSFAFPFTEILAEMTNEYFAGTLDKSEYLYEDYETYLQLHKGINALYAGSRVNSNDKFKKYINIYSVVGADTEVEYRVSIAPKKSEDYTVFMDWSSKSRVILGEDYPNGTYNFKFEARTKGGTEAEQTYYQTFTVK